VLALEYALRHPAHVARLILMNPAPASAADFALLREVYIEQLGPVFDRQREIMATAAYKEGDPETVAARYGLHFTHALARPADYERLMARMKAGFIAQGNAGILEAWQVEDRLMADTWASARASRSPRSSFTTTTSSRARSPGTSRKQCRRLAWSRSRTVDTSPSWNVPRTSARP
jgi:pimeloyl-ACP methyl ester carboxylesterase